MADKYSHLSREELVQRILELEKNRDYDVDVNENPTLRMNTQQEQDAMRMDVDTTIRQDDSPAADAELKTKNTASKKQKQAPKPKKENVNMDFSKYMQRPVAFKIAYFGWPYCGYASQARLRPAAEGEQNQQNEESEELETIEKYLFKALVQCRLIKSRETSGYARCGRTDRGVSAFGQVVSLWVRSKLPDSSHGYGVRPWQDVLLGEEQLASNDAEGEDERTDKGELLRREEQPASTEHDADELPYIQMLNRSLPEYIRVLAWAPTSENFSARFSCLSRTYKYFFPAHGLDISLMNQAAQKLIGEHDVRNFAKLDRTKDLSYTRRILSAEMRPVNDVLANEGQMGDFLNPNMSNYCVLTIRGTAFVWHQIRLMTHVLFLVGQKLEKPEVIDDLLNLEKHRDSEGRILGRPHYDMASEIPLVLWDCEFNNLQWQYPQPESSSPSQDRLLEHLFGLFRRHQTQSLLIGRLISDIIPQNKSKIASWSQVVNFHDGYGYTAKPSSYKPIMKRTRSHGIEEARQRRNARQQSTLNSNAKQKRSEAGLTHMESNELRKKRARI